MLATRVGMVMPRMSRAARRKTLHSMEWHEARLAEGPTGFIRERGADTWKKLHAMCVRLVKDWEALPTAERRAYAFRNPEDRRAA